MTWYIESKEEIDKQAEKDIADGTYLDDGAITVTCRHCGARKAILSAPCCDTRRKESMESFRKLFNDDVEDWSDK